ncbi:hypothetical protein PsYK624_080550 [Phanerochaete sordida]|uniref:Uncharacterized protein n=1 Tax=Phanerochaete sordida TaxID=48140 RepID=A0A9P3GCL8_9APHY|nr:hypothetical protein PsYK624_080550 [Phanerochaete sordida]
MMRGRRRSLPCVASVRVGTVVSSSAGARGAAGAERVCRLRGPRVLDLPFQTTSMPSFTSRRHGHRPSVILDIYAACYYGTARMVFGTRPRTPSI